MNRLLLTVPLLCLTIAFAAASIPDEVDLGAIEPGVPAIGALELTNDTEHRRTVSLLSSDASLEVTPQEMNLEPGETASIELAVTASEPGELVRLLTVLYDEGDPDVVVVRATVVAVTGYRPGEPDDTAASAGETGAVTSTLTVDLYMDLSCPSCRRLAEETLPSIAASAGYAISVEPRDVMDPAVMDRLLSALGARGLELDALPAAFVTTGDAGEPVVFQGFEDIERGAQALVHGTRLAGGDATDTTTGESNTSDPADGGRVFSVGAIVGAGLMDGINPCAFSTMLFLISMLALVGRSRREILVIGIIYSATVFAGYLATGFGLFASVRALMAFPVVVQGIRWLLVGLLGVLAVLSVRDGVLATQGRVRDMTLQLPEKMKRRVHDVVRSGTRNASLVGGTIVLGLGVTVFEFSCTGQVYVPVIMHLARTGSTRAVGLLLLYNVAFILPLLVIFALAYAGISMKSIGKVFERNVAAVKFGLAVVFAGLAVMTVVL